VEFGKNLLEKRVRRRRERRRGGGGAQ